MKFCLHTSIVKDNDEDVVNNAVILLHGYGGDGNDISNLTLGWKRHLKNTIFLCPNAPETCQINPNGYQWFDLSSDNLLSILEGTYKAETIINEYIDEVKIKYKLNDDNICLGGFSQGCMISINVGLTRSKKLNSILGFSGKIIDQKDLSSRIKSKVSTLLIHGDRDQIVPPSSLLDAKDFFIRNKIEIDTQMISNCEHHIPIEASSYALNFLKKNLKFNN